MRSLLARGAVLAGMPLLVGALLLMHGLEGLTSSGAEPAVSAVHANAAAGPSDHQGDGCTFCTASHAAAVCVAVLVALSVWRFGRRVASLGRAAVHTISERVRVPHRLATLVRSADPPWVRLAVMLC